jgi:pimeloyl-ACP methyl ester carboxylesterase
MIGAPADPIVGTGRRTRPRRPARAVPRLARHEIVLDDAHRVGVSVCGQGLPVVLVHGFTAEGILYAQTLSRLVRMGFKVVAIDVAGHGGTQGLPTDGANIDAYVGLLAGCSTSWASAGPSSPATRWAAGSSPSWRRRTPTGPSPSSSSTPRSATAGTGSSTCRASPRRCGGRGRAAAMDTLSTLPWLRNPRQAAKLGRLVGPTLVGHATRPWRLLGPAISLIRSQGTTGMLEALGDNKVPVVVIHGDRDIAVPYRTAVDAARRRRAPSSRSRAAPTRGSSRTPRPCPPSSPSCSTGPSPGCGRAAMGAAGPHAGATAAQIEDAFLGPHAWVRRLTPPTQFRTRARPAPARRATTGRSTSRPSRAATAAS